MLAFLEEGDSGYDAKQGRNPGDGLVINPEPVNTYLAEIEEFSNAVREKREPVNNALLGLRSQKLLSACYESAATGKLINVQ